MGLLRIGVLGAARITNQAMVKPAALVDEVELTAVAARDRTRAEAYAAKRHIPRVLGSYAELIADPDVDAIYNPLPNGLHGHWTIAALEAGKHVLCEKPFTANAEEAEAVAAVAERTGLVCMEAFHYRYHPLTARLIEIVESGELGEVERIETRMCIPLLPKGDIRWDLRLAGGTLMDVGCYAIHQLRDLCGGEPAVLSARAEERSPGVDRLAEAQLRLPNGGAGQIRVSMLSHRLLSIGLQVVGDQGRLKVFNSTAPQALSRVTVSTRAGKRRETTTRQPTYRFQLRAFADAVLRGAPTLTPPADSVANMRAIDAVYRAAGMEPRQPTPV